MTAQPRIREPAIAGQFYPAEPEELRATVTRLLDAAPLVADAAPPKALIAPHAGYPYSGPVAASVYAHIRPLAGKIRRVILLGPSHRVPFRGIATTTATAYRSPLGDIPVDHEALDAIADLPGVQLLDIAHGPEHSLEAHLPFLQVALGEFELVPLVVGDASSEQVASVLERLWGGPETLIVVSSDLSHFHDYATACRLDTATTRAIEQLDEHALGPEQACGCRPLAGLLRLARQRGLTITTLDQRNSGDTAGPRRRASACWNWPRMPSGGPRTMPPPAPLHWNRSPTRYPIPAPASSP